MMLTKQNFWPVLYTTNVNDQNEIVLNDDFLLRLILGFPFLYNPNVEQFNDPDYNFWAWSKITKDFNRSYENLNRNVSFTMAELKERWMTLQPIVHRLSKVTNLKPLPDSLRETVIKISNTNVKDFSDEPFKKPLTPAQMIIHQNIPMVKKLPILKRRQLEAEMMELILKSELDSKATIRLGTNVEKYIEKEYQNFMHAAGLEEIGVKGIEVQNTNNDANGLKGIELGLNGIGVKNINNDTNGSKEIELGNIYKEAIGLKRIGVENNHKTEIEVKNLNKVPAAVTSKVFVTKILNSNEMINKNTLNVKKELIVPMKLVKVKPETLDNNNLKRLDLPLSSKNHLNKDADGLKKTEVDNLKNLNFKKIQNEKALNVEPELIVRTEIIKKEIKIKQEILDTKNVDLSSKSKWVPLGQWRNFVRKCRVRVKRTKLEDDIPLMNIKRRKIVL